MRSGAHEVGSPVARLLMAAAFLVACGGSPAEPEGDEAAGGAAGEPAQAPGGETGAGGQAGAQTDPDPEPMDDPPVDVGGAGGAPLAMTGGVGGSAMGGMAGTTPPADDACPGKGKTIAIAAGQDVAAALAMAKGGETIEFAAGMHGAVKFDRPFGCETRVKGGTLASLELAVTKNLVLEEMSIKGKVQIDRSEAITLRGVKISAETVCVLARDNTELTFEGSECLTTHKYVIERYSNPAMAFSGKNVKLRIVGNRIKGPGYPKTDETEHYTGLLILGQGTKNAEDVLVANNLVTDFWAGISLAGCKRCSVANNTAIRVWIGFWEKWAENASGQIVQKSEELRLFNNVFASDNNPYRLLYIANGKFQDGSVKILAPALNSHNFYSRLGNRAATFGGSGTNALTGNHGLGADFKPGAGSSLIDAGRADPLLPTTDLAGKMRAGNPDIGAYER